MLFFRKRNTTSIIKMSDLYDAEFERLMLRAKQIIMKMTNSEDRKICAHWVAKLCKMQSEDIAVKKYRNDFFKYMVQIIGQGTLAGPFQAIPDQGPLPNFTYDSEQGAQQTTEKDEEPMTMTRWSDDERTYVAVKAIPNQGAIIYMAVSKDPCQGWEMPQSDNLI